jgi:hypothetical protein
MITPFPAAPVADLALYLERIWNQEGGSPCSAEYFAYMAEGVGVRDALMRLESDLLAGPRPIVRPESVPAPAQNQTIVVAVRQDDRSRYSAAARKAWATRRARLAGKHHR